MCPGCVSDSDASLVEAGGTVAAGTTSLRRLRRRLRVYVPAADTSTECASAAPIATDLDRAVSVDRKDRRGAATASPARAWRVDGRLIGRYLFVLAVYVALAVVTLAEHRNVVVLNWIMGPLFLFIILYVIPECVRCLARRMGPR